MNIMKTYTAISLTLLMLMLMLFRGSSDADPLDNWVTVTSGTNDWLHDITYGGGKFVIVGASGTVLTSPDGVAWTKTSGDSHLLYGLGFGNNTFVAVGALGRVLTSPDGITWTLRRAGQAHPLSHDLFGVAYGVIGGVPTFVAVGGHGTTLSSIDNGITWYSQESGTVNWLYEIIYKNSLFVDVGAYGTTLWSTNGANWYPGTSNTNNHLLGVAYGNAIFVAVGEAGTILTSDDGVTWTVQPPLDPEWLRQITLRGIAYDNGTFAAVGDYGTLITSPDGINWTVRNSGTTRDLERIAYGSAFVAVGGFGTILLDGDSIPTNPVRISQPYEVFFATIQAAYNNATSGDVDSMALHFTEDLNFNSDKSVILKGGYNSTFGDNPSYTTLNGSLTISNGTVTVENLIIQ
jgi:hypothetical protein